MLVWRSMAGSPISICSRSWFDRAVFVALCLWLCMFLRFYACGAVCCQGFLLLLVALIDRYRCYGVMLMALRAFARLCLRFTGRYFFCAVEVACRCGFMFLLLSFSAARGFRLFELLKRSTAFCADSRGDERLFIVQLSILFGFG